MSPNDLYCVEWDVKPYSTQPNPGLEPRSLCLKFQPLHYCVTHGEEGVEEKQLYCPRNSHIYRGAMPEPLNGVSQWLLSPK